MGDKDETRNLILAVVLSMLVIIGWYAIFPPPDPAPPPEQEAADRPHRGASPRGQGQVPAGRPPLRPRGPTRSCARRASDRDAGAPARSRSQAGGSTTCS